MNKDEIAKIKEHIEIHARLEPRAIHITEIMRRAVVELEHIAELEQENAILKGRTEGFEKQILGLLYKYESVYKRFPDLKDAMNEAERLSKENAELKSDNDARKFAMAMSEKVEKQLREENSKLKKQLENRNCSNCRRSKTECPNDGSCHNFSLYQPFKNSEL